MASEKLKVEIFTPEQRAEFDADAAELATVRQAIIDEQLTPATDEERSLVAMTLWRHRHGEAFGVQACIGGSYLHDCKHVAVKLGVCKYETFGELWRSLLPKGVDEVRAINAVLKFSRLLGEDYGRYMIVCAARDIFDLQLSPAVVADRMEQGYTR